MPYSICTVCGQLSHLSVVNLEDWYTKYYPGIPAGSVVPGKCFYCWQELTEGDNVLIRHGIGDAPLHAEGRRGRILTILSSKEGDSIFHVQLDSGEDRYFIRADLRKPLPDEA